jgi:hypothetical protein
MVIAVSGFVFYSPLYFFCFLGLVHVASGFVGIGGYGPLGERAVLLLAEMVRYDTPTRSQNRGEVCAPPPVTIQK